MLAKITNSRLVRKLSSLAGISASAAMALSMASPAAAVPSFAAQTGQACQACHVGAFGPQLTAFGREFKLQGYTMRSGGWNVPISAMAVASYVQTQKAQAAPPASGFGTNDNSGWDQFSIFVAGGLGSNLGAFIQTTYDGIGKAWSWDNLDIRAVKKVEFKGADVLLGASLNNNPTVQDPWNTTPAWGYPYTSSALAPSPAAGPLLAGGLATNTLGVTTYAWINSTYYVELGAYQSMGAQTLRRLGADPYGPGDISGVAPYGRIAMQKPFANGILEVGAFGLQADIHPARDRSTGVTDNYTDLGLDTSWLYTTAGGSVLSLNARYTHEDQNLHATCLLGAGEGGPDPACTNNTMQDIRVDASYYWQDKIGGTVAVFDTTANANAVLYPDAPTSKPNSSGAMFQVDGTPWGATTSPLGPRFNMRVGAQYFVYQRFNGAARNYDGTGAKAGDNNTLRLFAWVAY
jgi:hypothetical protein